MIPVGYIAAADLGNAMTLSRHRRAGLLPAPLVINKYRVYSTEQIEEYRRLRQLGEDRYMQQSHGRGRPSLKEIARLALAKIK